MIGYISGRVISAHADRVLILCKCGVGYEVYFYWNWQRNKNIVNLFISTKSSEYGEALYGFETNEEKRIFEILSSIKGVGPRLIFKIMNSLQIKSFSDLEKIQLSDLVKVSGVGKTTANRFLLGLSAKLKKEINEYLFDLNQMRGNFDNNIEDVVDVLVDWGMNRNKVLEFISIHENEIKNLDSASIIQYVLKNIK